ncbi:MAG: flagellar filament capping protein FliD [Sphingomonadales bacterium]|nr:flagellar filament capping protein FliD [Sphingomonadales bacterium]MDE2569054.1 flagellar filament capping protein FliD [Sphingomonadales bacterium]
MTTTGSTSSTTSTSPGAAILATLGSASGIDMNALAQNIATAEFLGRNNSLTAQSTQLQTQISDASALKSQLLTLASSVGDRVRTGDLAATPSIANASVASVSAGTGGGGKGVYTLEVSSIAASQVVTSPPYTASTDTVGSGSLTLRFGTISGGTFTEDTAHAATTITIAAGSTLADAASAINAANAGVTAYVASTSSGAQLVLKGSEGATNAFVLDATETAGDPGLASLAWTAADTSRQVGTAADAAFKLDGVAMTSATNALTDIAPGLSMTLTGTNIGSPTRITFANPTSAITTTMSDLAGALNEIVTSLTSDTDAKTGSLNGDPGARALRTALSQLPSQVIMPNAADGSPRTLADLGLRINRDGTFDIDSTRLSATLASDPAGAAAMFTTGIYGVYSTMDSMSRKLTSITDPASIGYSIARFTTKATDVTRLQSDLAARQAAEQQRLIARFSHTDSVVGGYKSTLTFIQAQIAAWNTKGN